MDAAAITRPGEGLDPPRELLRPMVELATVIGLLELELWHLRAHGAPWLNALIYGVIVATVALSYRRRQSARSSKLTASVGIGRAWAESVAACLVLSTVLGVAATLVGDANETFEFVFLDKPPLRLLNWLVGKLGAALLQQLALQMFLWPVCRELTGSRPVGTVLAASIFGLIHLPSPTLVAITTLAGVAWISLYQRSGRLAPLVVTHMILATLAHGGLPERLTYDMRVGLMATADLKRYASAEYYRAQGGTKPDFIRGLYRDILGRAASAGDLAFWTGRKLANPRDEIPSIFLGSDEFARLKQARRAGARPTLLR